VVNKILSCIWHEGEILFKSCAKPCFCSDAEPYWWPTGEDSRFKTECVSVLEDGQKHSAWLCRSLPRPPSQCRKLAATCLHSRPCVLVKHKTCDRRDRDRHTQPMLPCHARRA
jgi:hypothetical protein